MTVNIGALVSGRGSNLDAILKAIATGKIKGCSVKVVISNRPGAPALKIAEKAGVATETIDSSGFKGERRGYDALVIASLQWHGVVPEDGLVLLAGFDRIVSSEFVTLFAGRMMNIHPALLPSFPGLNAQKQALEYGSKVAGCTVHFVVPEVDAGPVILQKAVPVKEGDTERALSERILRQEHKLYPEAVRLFAEGKLKIEGRRVVIR